MRLWAQGLLLLAWLAFGGGVARAAVNYEPYTFTHLAGSPAGVGYCDATGSDARFNNPNGVALDSSGNIYVADQNNHAIRKITPGGEVTTLAGLAGSTGSADGTGSLARFNLPSGVAVDSSGNIYVADQNNHTIRKITAGAVVTTFAGLAGNRGSTDGTGSTARFNLPSGVAVDSSDAVYVADAWNHTIRKITPSGVVSTLAGRPGVSGSVDATGSTAVFNRPSALAVDSSGNLYVADQNNHTIRKVTPTGVVSTVAGLAGSVGSADGTGSTARFNYPSGVAVDSSDKVYVADKNNYTVRRITPGGGTVVTTVAGLAGSLGSADGTGSTARFCFPQGIAVDASGNAYVTDSSTHIIRKITVGGEVTTLAGLVGSLGSIDSTGSDARFNYPSGVAVDSSGNVYVADWNNFTIRKITPGGVVSTLAGLAGSIGSADGTGGDARFSYPYGAAVDSSGNVYVADTSNHTIRKITPDRVVSTLAGLAGSSGSADGTGGDARFNYPYGVAADSFGNVYVADSANNTIRKITPDGIVTTLAGLARSSGSADGTGSAARFNFPYGVALDSLGNVYVADSNNSTVRKITPGGVVTTLAGLAWNRGSVDGTGSAARFDWPYGVAVDSSGNVYVADTYNYTIRRITPGGVVTTLGGLAGRAGSADGIGSAAHFSGPSGVAVDSSGNVYVADRGNHAIRKGAVTPRVSIAPDGTGGVFIQVQGPGNRNYQLHRAQTLNGQWITNGVQTAPASGFVEFHDLFPPTDRAFYRAFQE